MPELSQAHCSGLRARNQATKVSFKSSEAIRMQASCRQRPEPFVGNIPTGLTTLRRSRNENRRYCTPCLYDAALNRMKYHRVNSEVRPIANKLQLCLMGCDTPPQAS